LSGKLKKTKMLEILAAVGERQDVRKDSGNSRGKCHTELSNC